MLRNLHRALGALPPGLALWAGSMIAAACGGGDGGSTNPPSTDSGGVGGTSSSTDIGARSRDGGSGDSIIERLQESRWRLVALSSDGEVKDLETIPSEYARTISIRVTDKQRNCGIRDHEEGDACVDFSCQGVYTCPPDVAVLSGTRLFLHVRDYGGWTSHDFEGEVLENVQRLRCTYTTQYRPTSYPSTISTEWVRK